MENAIPNIDHVQAELMDMITKDVSPSQISDKIKDMLFAKSAERVDAYKPTAADSIFGNRENEVEDEIEAETDTVDAEVEDETDDE